MSLHDPVLTKKAAKAPIKLKTSRSGRLYRGENDNVGRTKQKKDAPISKNLSSKTKALTQWLQSQGLSAKKAAAAASGPEGQALLSKTFGETASKTGKTKAVLENVSWPDIQYNNSPEKGDILAFLRAYYKGLVAGVKKPKISLLELKAYDKGAYEAVRRWPRNHNQDALPKDIIFKSKEDEKKELAVAKVTRLKELEQKKNLNGRETQEKANLRSWCSKNKSLVSLVYS